MNVTNDELSISVNNLPEVDYSFGVDENCSIDQDISSSTNNVGHEIVEDQMEDGELSDCENLESTSTSTLEVGHLTKQPDEKKQVRQYLNKAGEFVVGIDLFSADAKAKAEERIRRFGQVVRPDDIVTDGILAKLYKNLGVEGPTGREEGTDPGETQVRYSAIHLRGTDDLSTKDIFDYFGEFAPTSVEWIDDHSCNVVWPEASSAARAMLKLSCGADEEKREGDQDKKKEADEVGQGDNEDGEHENMEVDKADEDNDKNRGGEDDEDDDDDDEDDKESRRYRGRSRSTTNDHVNLIADVVRLGVDASCKREPEEKWRVGNPHPRSRRQLFMRFATTNDKKQAGANVKSRYYMKHGNPNFGGIKGLMTKSWKQRYISSRRRREQPNTKGEPEATNGDMDDRRRTRRVHVSERLERKRSRLISEEEEGEDKEVEGSVLEVDDGSPVARVNADVRSDAPRSKVPRMRMYADDEDDVRDTRRDRGSNGGSVWGRLGLQDDGGVTRGEKGRRPRNDLARSRRRS